MNPAYDRIEVLYPSTADQNLVSAHVAAVQKVQFNRITTVRSRAYSPHGSTMSNAVASVSLSAAETDILVDLLKSHFRSQLVLKYPSPAMNLNPDELSVLFTKWSKAISRDVPANYDMVYLAPPTPAQAPGEWIPCAAYVMSRGGAEWMAMDRRGFKMDRKLRIFQLEF